MKIRRMTATFGRLQNETLELGEGLNIIEAPNEAGKSTWSAFIRAMLYGIPTKERDRQGFIAEKNRYQPWSGAAMEGRMEIRWKGREIILLRGPSKTPFGQFEARDSLTGALVPELTAENVGEMLIGAPREVFERSAFVGQGAAAVESSPALEKRISALVSSGEEDVSFSQVERKLKDWLNSRKHNKTGAIPRLEEELSALEEALHRQSRAHHSARESAAALQELEDERELLRQEMAAHRYEAESEQKAAWDQARQELDEALRQEENIRAELERHGKTPDRETLREAQAELNALRGLEREIREAEAARAAACQEAVWEEEDPLFADADPEEAYRRAEQMLLDLEKLEWERSRAPVGAIALGIAGLAAGVAGAALGIALPEHRVLCMAGGGILMAAAVLITVLCEMRRRKRLERKRSAFLSHCGAEEPADIRRRAQEFEEKWEKRSTARTRLEEAERRQAELVAQREERQNRVASVVHSFAPDARDAVTLSAALSKGLFLWDRLDQAAERRESAQRMAERIPEGKVSGEKPQVTPRYDSAYTAARLSAVEGEAARLNNVLSMAKGELRTLGDPAMTLARREAVKEELEDRGREYDALTMALEGLEQANSALQERFSPAVNQRSGAILAQLTGGKYDKITLTRTFEAMAEEKDGILPRRVLTLSQGTADQVYLAVRLAMCELALSNGGRAPLVLDDALTNFDDERMGHALDTLLELAQERQILLFTCHSREGNYLSHQPSVRRISLDS